MEVVLVLFDKDKKNVLMCGNKFNSIIDFPHIIVNEMEQPHCAALRCLDEVLNISSDCCELEFVRRETVARRDGQCSSTYVMCGVISTEKDFPEDSLVCWVPINNSEVFTITSARCGACFVYLRESCKITESR